MNRLMKMAMMDGDPNPFTVDKPLSKDAALYPGQLGIDQRLPTVSSLPGTVVNGARVVLEGTPKVEYLGRSVVELTADSIDIPFFDYTTDSWEIEATINDVNVGVKSWPAIWNVEGNNGDTPVVTIFALQNSTTVQGLFGFGKGIQLNSVLPVFDGKFHSVAIGAVWNTGYMKVDGAITSTVDITAWREATPIALSHNRIYDTGTTLGTTPLQVASIRQSVNGVLIDNIHCDESTGTTLRNTVSPDRPATLSDATAHALAWVAQPIATLGLWQSDGTDWVALT